ncbi:hypothetical protein [Actinomadura parmotrematis]|uniref:hypothetical protein n=1 Tax=Actinomadura parmotrematis TaxID=2864039 RepID=UPI00215D66BA|nr:hypothetical protein [Actinomadura parmotrematis]
MRIIATVPIALCLSLAAACGGGGGRTGASSASPTANVQDKGVQYAQCLRQHGLDVKDPEPGKGLMLTLKGVPKDVVDKAMEACRQYDPMAEQSGAVDPKMEENGRKYAACMRQHGVEKFPDPQPGQRGIRITPEVGEDPDFAKADQTCRPIMQGQGK